MAAPPATHSTRLNRSSETVATEKDAITRSVHEVNEDGKLVKWNPPAAGATPGSAGKHANGHADAVSSPAALGSRTIDAAANGLPVIAAGRVGIAVQSPAAGYWAGAGVRGETRLTAANAVQGGNGSSPQVLASGPAKLDVGIFDGTHGWLRIRAELGAGGAVNASLTASASAHESLRAALPEMSSYLAAEAVSVSRIAVHRVAADSSAMAGANDRQNGQQNGEAQGHHQAGEQGRSGAGPLGRNAHPVAKELSRAAVVAPHPAINARAGSAAGFRGWNGGLAYPAPHPGLGYGLPGSSSGGWLNVCA
jgi:hypothetical protein